MQLTDYIIIVLLTSSLLMFIVTSMKKCPKHIELKPQIIYKYSPELDLQFDERNFPSKVYNDVFNGQNPTIGGYELSRKTIVLQKN